MFQKYTVEVQTWNELFKRDDELLERVDSKSMTIYWKMLIPQSENKMKVKIAIAIRVQLAKWTMPDEGLMLL